MREKSKSQGRIPPPKTLGSADSSPSIFAGIEDATKTKVATLSPEYLRHIYSKEWEDFRNQIIDLRGEKCERCGTTTSEVQVHHLTYDNLGFEKPEDVMVLCSSCHKS